MSLSNLQGRVVMINFWSYSCLECLRTIPFLKEIWRIYREHGFVLIGVHAPDFSFERTPENVEAFCLEHKILWPNILDNDFRVSEYYANRVHPAIYLIDDKGTIKQIHCGVDQHAQMESALQHLVKEIEPKAQLPKAGGPHHTNSQRVRFPSSPTIRCGYEFGRIGNEEGCNPGQAVEYTTDGLFEENVVYLRGLWQCNTDNIQHVRSSAAHDESARVTFHGIQVGVVAGSAAKTPAQVYITLDGSPLSRDMAAKEVEFSDGESVISIKEPRLYKLMKSDHLGTHVLRLFTDSPDLQIYALEFGGCKG
jgi:thiol-disulfide isomerase/thioredoxin